MTTEIALITGGETHRPPKLPDKQHILSYLLVLLAQAEAARQEIPRWDDAKMGTDKALFRRHQAARDSFWLHYGGAAKALDFAMQTNQIDDAPYDKLRAALKQLLISTTIG